MTRFAIVTRPSPAARFAAGGSWGHRSASALASLVLTVGVLAGVGTIADGYESDARLAVRAEALRLAAVPATVAAAAPAPVQRVVIVGQRAASRG